MGLSWVSVQRKNTTESLNVGSQGALVLGCPPGNTLHPECPVHATVTVHDRQGQEGLPRGLFFSRCTQARLGPSPELLCTEGPHVPGAGASGPGTWHHSCPHLPPRRAESENVVKP